MEEKSRKPEDTPFKQQRLKAWQPILTPNWVIGTFALVGIIFIPIGVVLNNASDNVVEYSVQYDGADYTQPSNVVSIGEGCQLANDSVSNTFDVDTRGCTITFEIDKDMEAPIYVYYQLNNFYQNHRRYVQSRSDSQLRGDASASTSDCDPLTTETTIKYNSTSSDPIDSTEQEYNLNPCGLIANSLFNDMIWVNSLSLPNGSTYGQNDTFNGDTLYNLMDQTGIAWQSDIDSKFKNIDESDRTDSDLYLWQNPNYRYNVPMYTGQPAIMNKTTWTSAASAYGVKDEHFIVWMRTAGLPNFRKLYGKIDTDLSAGTKLQFLVSSNFLVSTFDGKKYLVLSTTSWFGGKNPFLGIAYIVVGALCMFLAILFFAKHKLSPRKLGDTRYLVWKNNQ